MAKTTKYAPELTYRKAAVVPRRRDLKVPTFPVGDPEAAARAVAEVIHDFAYEHLVVLYFDVRNKVMGYDISTMMSPTETAVATQSIIRNAMLMTAIAVVTAHQHPTGDPTPSAHDERLWKILRMQAEIMQIVVLDNLVVTDGQYYSEAENGVGVLKKNPGGRVVYPKLKGPEAVRLVSNPGRCADCGRLPGEGHEDGCHEDPEPGRYSNLEHEDDGPPMTKSWEHTTGPRYSHGWDFRRRR